VPWGFAGKGNSGAAGGGVDHVCHGEILAF
jgi:hypothetical protein